MPWPITPGSRPTSSHRQSTPGPTSRPSSRLSAYSMTTPRSSAVRDSLADEFGDSVGPVEGLGDSLANELGDGEWTEEFDGEYFEGGDYDGEDYTEYGDEDADGDGRDRIEGVNGAHTDGTASNPAGTSFPTYDGSEYGDPGLSAELDAAIRAVAEVIRQSVEQSGISEAGELPIPKVPQELTILPSQAAIESGVARLVATHGALAGHITHQTRVVASLGSALLSPLAPPVAPDEAAELARLLGRLLLELPRPTNLSSQMPIMLPVPQSPTLLAAHHRHRQQLSGPPVIPDTDIPPVPQSALVTLHNLYASTTSMLGQLSQLTDSLHVFRQSHAAAAKRLATTKLLVTSLRKEMDEAEEAEEYLKQGDWDRKLRERVVSSECRRVVDGFESTWRGRLAVLEEG